MVYLIDRFFVIGILVALISDFIWVRLRYKKWAKSIVSDEEAEKQGLKLWATLEHYHWGLLYLTIGLYFKALCKVMWWQYWWGLGVALIVSEAGQKNRFGYGKDHFRDSTIIGILLIVLLIYEIRVGISWGFASICMNRWIKGFGNLLTIF